MLISRCGKLIMGIRFQLVSTVYSKIHSAGANCVTATINTYIFTIHGIEMSGTSK
jgi:hypothetical protein